MYMYRRATMWDIDLPIQAKFPNQDISNPNKNSLGTKRSGLTKFDCNSGSSSSAL